MKHFAKTIFLVFLSAAFALPAAVAQQSPKSTDQNESSGAMSKSKTSDATFLKKAAEGGLAEIELGQLAQQKASSEEVKKFGERMVSDHTKANDELKAVAQKENVELPQEPSAKDKATKARLEKLSGAQFDQAYMKDMVKDHRTDVSEFEHESNSAQDPAVKSFATQTLPVLKEHLRVAEKISPMQKKTASAANPAQ